MNVCGQSVHRKPAVDACKAESNKFPMCDAQISQKKKTNSAYKKRQQKTTEKHFKIHLKWIPHKNIFPNIKYNKGEPNTMKLGSQRSTATPTSAI